MISVPSALFVARLATVYPSRLSTLSLHSRYRETAIVNAMNALVSEEYLVEGYGKRHQRGLVLAPKSLRYLSEAKIEQVYGTAGVLDRSGRDAGETHASLWTFLVLNGSTDPTYGSVLTVMDVPQDALHLLLCGLDSSQSRMPEFSSWSCFDGTFAEQDREEEGLVGWAYCHCGRVRSVKFVYPTSLGESGLASILSYRFSPESVRESLMKERSPLSEWYSACPA